MNMKTPPRAQSQPRPGMGNDPFGLAQASRDFADVRATPRMSGQVPDGTYLVRVTRTTLKQATSGHGRLEWVLTIEDGPYTGETLIKSSSWHTETCMTITLADLAACGIRLDGAQIGYLGSHYNELEGLLLQVRYLQTDTDSRVYIQSLMHYADEAY